MFLKRKIYLLSLFLLLNLLPLHAAAGNIDFSGFNVIGKPPNYTVQTGVSFKLTNYMRQALLNGIALNARIQFRLGEHRSWWFNKDVPLLTVHYQLKYHALSRHYLLSRSDTGENWNFSTLPTALRKLGELRSYKLPPIKEPVNNGQYYLFAIADMSPATLRLPLRIQSLFSDEYKLTSEGVLWPLP